MQTLALLSVIMRNPSEEHYGLELGKAAKLKSGTLYPTLARLEAAGWLDSAWEDLDPTEAGRPRRRLYRLTGEGERSARRVFEEHERMLAPEAPPSRTGKVQPA
jgi:DNA-binding PadR family transcriptional regulator